MVKVEVLMDDCDAALYHKVDGAPRILGYRNLLAWFNARKHLDKINLDLSLAPLSKKGRVFLFGDVGTNTHRENEVHECIRVELDKKQAKELGELLLKKSEGKG